MQLTARSLLLEYYRCLLVAAVAGYFANMMALRNRYAVTESRGRFSRVTVTALPSTSRR